MKQLKLEVGKTYRNRKGEEVKIVGKDNVSKYHYHGSDDKWYAESGQWWNEENPHDLIEEVPSETTRRTFIIPEGVKEITVEQVSNRIIVEMVPEAKDPKPGDVMINKYGGVYIFKSIEDNYSHNHYAWLRKSGRLVIGVPCYPGRLATPEEAQPLWDALKKSGEAVELRNYAGGGCIGK